MNAWQVVLIVIATVVALSLLRGMVALAPFAADMLSIGGMVVGPLGLLIAPVVALAAWMLAAPAIAWMALIAGGVAGAWLVASIAWMRLAD